MQEGTDSAGKTREMNKTIAGLFLLAISIIIASLFFIQSYHDLYWSHPVTFILLSIIGVFGALYGGFLAGNNSIIGKTSKGWLSGTLIGLGALITFVGGLAGLAAIIMAISITGTGYWGSAPYEYSGDYLIMGLQILVFRASILPEIIGGFLLGLGLRKRG